MKNQNSSLEGVRGAAAFVVMLYHAGVPFPTAIRHGYLAVDLFFVLSGFVICSAYGASLSSGAQIGTFVVRRFGRLWPVHIATTILFYAVANVVTMLSTGTLAGLPPLSHVAALATMTQGLNLFPDMIGTKVNWSASDEFYVYLVFAALCFLLRGKARLVAFGVLAMLGYAIAVAASIVRHDCLRTGDCLAALNCSFGWARCIAGFFVGALVAEFKNVLAMRVMSRRIPQLLAFAATLLFMSYSNVLGLAFAAPLVFGAFVASLACDSGPIAKFFHERPFQYLGRISYSLYLGHAVVAPLYAVAVTATSSPLVNFAAIAAFFAASVVLAHLLNRFVETPCRQYFYGLSSVRVRSPSSSPSSVSQ
ncbi:acyltransferase family protein [Trinickia mobilis]|uniref:acyltransferase family protein n=1 Tax=Trinickia mobilis TaxID=2816356 RepID=UPI001A8F3C14|nr:acyltransferase [Trinickia mobilis]